MPRLEGQGTRGGNKGSRCRESYATKVRLHLYLFVLLQRTESPCFQTFFSSSSLLLLPVLPAVACLLLAIRSFLLSYLLFLLHRRKGPSKHPSASPPSPHKTALKQAETMHVDIPSVLAGFACLATAVSGSALPPASSAEKLLTSLQKQAVAVLKERGAGANGCTVENAAVRRDW